MGQGLPLTRKQEGDILMKLHKWNQRSDLGTRFSILACSVFILLFAQAADYTLENESVSWTDSDNDSGKNYQIKGEVIQ